LFLVPLSASAAVAFVSSHFAQGSNANPTITRTAAPGNFLFALVTVNGTVTCIPAAGWAATTEGSVTIQGNFSYCAFYRANATGSDSYAFGISASFPWTIAVAEFSGIATINPLRTSGAIQQATNAPQTTSGSTTSGDLVIAGLADNYQFGPVTSASGFTAFTPTGATQQHYGTSFLMMGALAWKQSPGGAQTAQWGLADTHFSLVGIHAFAAAPSSAGDLVPASRLAQANWSVAGVTPNGGIPARTTICGAQIQAATYGNGTTNATTAIQNAINACPVGQTVSLSAGKFRVDQPIYINKGITLRGAGAGATTLEKTNGALRPVPLIPANTPQFQEYAPIIVVGNTLWPSKPSFDNASAVNLTADAVKGNRSVTVTSTAGLSVGQFIEIAEDQYYTGSGWATLPNNTNGDPNPYQIWKNDRITWARHNPTCCNDDPFPVGLTWFSRGNGYSYGEVKEIESIAGTTVTFTTPFTDTYRVSRVGQLAKSSTSFVTGAGVENMSLTRGSKGSIHFGAAAKSWAKNVEIYEWFEHAFWIQMSHKIEITGSYVRRAAWPVNGGAGYAITLSDNSSEALITNNITMDTNKNIVANSGGAGSVVSYNYFDDSYTADNPLWHEVSANGSHMAGSHHMLFEGNRATNFDSDFTHGSSYTHTVLRNHFTGFRRDPNLAGTQNNVRTIGLHYGSLNFSFAGNVLGLQGQMTNWLYESGTSVDIFANPGRIWQLGYDPKKWWQQSDPQVIASTIRQGNFNYLTNAVQWAGAASTVPASYYLSAKPTFFGTCVWPWVDSTGTTKLRTLPAKARYDAGAPLDTLTNRCP
jgi:Pectate lyase superfamily protein